MKDRQRQRDRRIACTNRTLAIATAVAFAIILIYGVMQ